MNMIRMTNAEYHADRSAISKSGLDWISKSPAHFYAKYLDPNAKPSSKSEALIIGSGVHKAILEPNEFSDEFMIAPEINKRTNDGKQQYADFQQRYAGKELITMETYNTIMRMRDSVLAHPVASELLTGGVAEQSIFWTDPVTGVRCKCRPDYITKHRIIADVKSTDDASPEGFGRSAAKYRYHVQAPFYVDGYESYTGQLSEGFVFVAVEKSPPYAVALYFVDGETMTLGRDLYRRELAVYRECLKNQQWPSYDTQISNLRLPPYAFKI